LAICLTSPWGFTGIFAKENGGGFLVDHYPQARKAIWDFHGIYTNSRHIPGVRWAGIIHPGLIGCLPDRELLERANRREAELLATNPDRVPPLLAPPYAPTALMGQMTGRTAQTAAQEAWRTVPPREHGGNCDIKNLSRGSKIYFPVYVKGGGLSMGDIHWANSREAELLATNPDRVPPLLAPPYAPTALMGQMTGRTAKQEMAELAEL
jgi:formamidase